MPRPRMLYALIDIYSFPAENRLRNRLTAALIARGADRRQSFDVYFEMHNPAWKMSEALILGRIIRALLGTGIAANRERRLSYARQSYLDRDLIMICDWNEIEMRLQHPSSQPIELPSYTFSIPVQVAGTRRQDNGCVQVSTSVHHTGGRANYNCPVIHQIASAPYLQ